MTQIANPHVHNGTVPNPERLSEMFIGLIKQHMKDCTKHGPSSMTSNTVGACMNCQAFVCKVCSVTEHFYKSVMAVHGGGEDWVCNIIIQGDLFAAGHLHNG